MGDSREKNTSITVGNTAIYVKGTMKRDSIHLTNVDKLGVLSTGNPEMSTGMSLSFRYM